MSMLSVRRIVVSTGILLSFSLQAQVNFSHDYNNSCPPAFVTFTNNSTQPGVDYYVWEFWKSGVLIDTLTAYDTTYTFTTGGNFEVELRGYDSLGGFLGSTRQGLDVIPAVWISADSACPGDLIFFEGHRNSGGGNRNYYYDFGDGNTVTGDRVSHSYSSIGTYTTAYVDPDCSNDTSFNDIYIGNGVYPDANINFWPDTICPDDNMSFEAFGSAGSFYWMFGDGSDTTLTDRNVYHSYSAPGNYSVTLIVTNSCGFSDTTIRSIVVQYGLLFNNWVNYELSLDTACPDDRVQLDCWNCEDYNYFVWDFGDGTLDTNTSRVSHTYASTGTYEIILTVTNGCGNSGDFYDTLLIANGITPDPANYEYGPIPPIACPGDTIILYSQGGGAGYFWDFGDGTSDSLPSNIEGTDAVGINHAYADTGIYDVIFTYTNGCGLSFTDTFNVTISDTASIFDFQGNGPPPFFWADAENGDPSIVCEEINFIALTGGSFFTWDFGDGNTDTSSSSNMAHTYDSAGVYTIHLLAENSCGDTASFYDDITLIGVCPILSASATGNGPTCADGNDGTATVTATLGAPPYNYLWNDPAAQTTATATALERGNYTVLVTDGVGDTVSANVTLTPLFDVTINVNVIDASCSGNDGVATASASGGSTPYIYQWSNGVIGSVDTALSSGFYVVSVTDNNGCSNFALASVSDNDGPIVSVVSTTDANCNGTGGAIDIFISQGSPPYTYLWSNGSTTQDVNNLAAGPHEVYVTDTSGCVGIKSIVVDGQAAFTLSTTTSDATCGNTDGSATVNVSGGTGPFTYSWSSGGSSATETSLGAGVYTVTVTDANTCLGSASAAVSNVGAPTITIDSTSEATCNGPGGSIFITVTGGTPGYTYNWSNGGSTQDLASLPADVYDLTVTDAGACISTESVVITMTLPTPQQLCMVTVDTVTGRNVIVWEKLVTQNIRSYYIYKESTQSNTYYLIDSVAVNAMSSYFDSVSDPGIRSWRYKISAVDSCGNESVLSEEHKTMHLNINLGLSSSINLIWDHYEGFSVTTYRIERFDGVNGWVVIDSVPSNLTSFTDFTPPAGNISYRIDVLHPTGCLATAKAKNYNSTRSNPSSAKETSVGDLPGGLSNLMVYPNPNFGVFNLHFTVPYEEDLNIAIYNAQGQRIFAAHNLQVRGSYHQQIDLSSDGIGVYFLQVVTSKGVLNKKLMIIR